jgi:DNA-binding transcriptional ArsR family regulator
VGYGGFLLTDVPEIPDGAGEDIEDFGGLAGLSKMKPESSTLKRLEKVYSLLSAKGRIEILYFLNFCDMTPGMLVYLTGMAPNLLSFHLKKLSEAGIIGSRKEGKFIIYSITDLGRNLAGPLG